jgi:hypothetical protein
MINFDGLSTVLALKVADRVKDQQIESIENSALSKREIESFKDKVSSINSIDDFINDYEVFSFMMKAYGLEEKIYAKGLMRKVFEGNLDDPDALVNRLNDKKIRDLAKAMDFSSDGKTNGSTSSFDWAEEQVDEYLSTRYINDSRDSNEGLGIILSFRDKSPDITSWLTVLGDKDLATFMRTVLNIPEQTAALDIDRQVEIMESKYNIDQLQDPAELDRLIQKYSIFKDAEIQAASVSQNPVLQILNAGSGAFAPITINVETISGFSRSAYR